MNYVKSVTSILLALHLRWSSWWRSDDSSSTSSRALSFLSFSVLSEMEMMDVHFYMSFVRCIKWRGLRTLSIDINFTSTDSHVGARHVNNIKISGFSSKTGRFHLQPLDSCWPSFLVVVVCHCFCFLLGLEGYPCFFCLLGIVSLTQKKWGGTTPKATQKKATMQHHIQRSNRTQINLPSWVRVLAFEDVHIDKKTPVLNVIIHETQTRMVFHCVCPYSAGCPGEPVTTTSIIAGFGLELQRIRTENKQRWTSASILQKTSGLPVVFSVLGFTKLSFSKCLLPSS